MKYPTLQDCELMVAHSNFFDNMRANGLTEPYRMFLQRIKQEHTDAAITEWRRLYGECFGLNSPWSIKLNSKKQKVVYWDDKKAQELGILTQN